MTLIRKLAIIAVTLAIIGLCITVYTEGYRQVTSKATATINLNVIPTSPPPPEGGGGGGGGGISETPDFIVEPSVIKVSLRQGELARKSINITNLDSRALDFTIGAESIDGLVLPNPANFSLRGGATQTVSLDIYAPETQEPDVYTGKLVVSAGGTQKTVNVIIDITQKKALLDVKIDVLTLEVAPGELASANITLINFGDLKPVDVTIEYALKDMSNNVIGVRRNVVNLKSETLALHTEKSLVRNIEVPLDARGGDYVFYVKASYNGSTAVGSDAFKVVAPDVRRTALIILFAVLAILLIFVGLQRLREKGMHRRSK